MVRWASSAVAGVVGWMRPITMLFGLRTRPPELLVGGQGSAFISDSDLRQFQRVPIGDLTPSFGCRTDCLLQLTLGVQPIV